MALSVKFSLLLMFIMLPLSSFASSSSPSSSLTCRPQINPLLHDLLLQCPTTILYSWPIEMDGESLDRVLSFSHMNAYIAILFYASWCPFSRNVHPKFAALSSMYPQIKHVTIEQSSVLPIVFSRHGIHGVPTIVIVNRTSTVQHHGPKDLQSLVHFYQKATGLEPAVDLTEDQIAISEDNSRILESCDGTSLNDIVTKEPYLIFSLFFLFLKAFVYLCPNIVSNMIALWAAYIPHLNLAIFGESRQLLARVLHLVDVKSAFSKLKLSKSRNFHSGAKSARVWASSLASFSLGKTPSARALHGGKL